MAYKKGGGFPIYFYIFERCGLNEILSKYMGSGLQEGGGLQERIRYVISWVFYENIQHFTNIDEYLYVKI